MSLLWVELANHGDKSMESSEIGHSILYFSEKLCFPDIQSQFLYVFAKT